MLRDFREFVVRGNVFDLAVGIVIGAAFGRIVASFVGDILMPPIGLLLGDVDVANLFVTLRGGSYPTLAAAQAAGAVTINYGVFLQTVIAFLIVAVAIFLMVRQVNRLTRATAAGIAPSMRPCPFCLSKVAVKATRCAYCTSELKLA